MENTKTNIKSKASKKEIQKRKKISIFGLVGISFLGIFNFSSMINNYAGLGLAAVPAYIIAVIIFLLPFTLIIAEFASLKEAEGKESGLNNWLNIATTRKIAFWTAFLFWFANLTYFMDALPSRIIFISFGATGKNLTSGPDVVEWFMYALPFISVAFFALATWISTKGTASLANFAKVGATLLISLVVIYFISGAVALGQGYVRPPNGDGGHIPFSDPNFMPRLGTFHFYAVFIWILMSADGAQGLGVYVNDMKGGQKSFLRGLFIVVIIIGLFYSFGTLIVEVFPPESGAYASGLFMSVGKMFQFLGISEQVSYHIIGWLMFIATFGGLLMWTSAPVKVFFSEAPNGFFPDRVTKLNDKGIPVMGAWIQFLVVIPFFFIPLIGSEGLDEFTRIVKTMGGSLGMLPPIFIFGGYIYLRLRKDYVERDFRIGSRKTGIAIGSFIFIVFSFIFIIGVMDSFGAENADGSLNGINILYGILINTAAIIIFFGPFAWALSRYEKRLAMVEYSKGKLTFERVTNHYNIKNQIKTLFNKEYKKDYQKEKEAIEVIITPEKVKKFTKEDSKKTKISNIKKTMEYQNSITRGEK